MYGQHVEDLPPTTDVGGGGEQREDEDDGVEEVLALLHIAMALTGEVVVQVDKLGDEDDEGDDVGLGEGDAAIAEGEVLVLRPRPEVPFASAPGAVEGHHGDDLDDRGAEPVHEPKGEGVGGGGAVDGGHADIVVLGVQVNAELAQGEGGGGPPAA